MDRLNSLGSLDLVGEPRFFLLQFNTLLHQSSLYRTWMQIADVLFCASQRLEETLFVGKIVFLGETKCARLLLLQRCLCDLLTCELLRENPVPRSFLCIDKKNKDWMLASVQPVSNMLSSGRILERCRGIGSYLDPFDLSGKMTPSGFPSLDDFDQIINKEVRPLLSRNPVVG